MPAMDLRNLQIKLEKQDPQNLYLVFGDEPYLVDQAVALLKAKALADGAADFNYDSFFAPDVAAVHVRDTVETLPMMSSRRVVIYRNADVLKEKDWAALLPLFENPVDSCVFILVGQSFDKRKKHYKKILESGVVVELNRPYDNQIPMWIEYIAFQNGLEISKDARSLIQQFIGQSLSEINNEVRKLKDFIGGKKKIEAEDVLNVVSKSKVNSVFDLTNAIGRRDRALALMHLANLLEQGQNEVGVVSMISRHVRILSIVREGMKSGLSGQRLSTKAGVPGFFLKDYMDQARSWGDPKIRMTMDALFETDKALKSSPVSSHIWLENFIIKTCDI